MRPATSARLCPCLMQLNRKLNSTESSQSAARLRPAEVAALADTRSSGRFTREATVVARHANTRELSVWCLRSPHGRARRRATGRLARERAAGIAREDREVDRVRPAPSSPCCSAGRWYAFAARTYGRRSGAFTPEATRRRTAREYAGVVGVVPIDTIRVSPIRAAVVATGNGLLAPECIDAFRPCVTLGKTSAIEADVRHRSRARPKPRNSLSGGRIRSPPAPMCQRRMQ